MSASAADVHHYAVEIHDRPDLVQRPNTPGRHILVQIGRDFRDQLGGNLDIVQLKHDLLDVARGHPLGIQGQNLLVEARHVPLVLADQLRLESAVAIARRGNRQFAHVGTHRFFGTPVAAV